MYLIGSRYDSLDGGSARRKSITYTGKMTLKEEHRLRVFESRVRRGIFGPKRGEITGLWGTLPNEVHNLYSSSNI
jgi:hypothetical protein